MLTKTGFRQSIALMNAYTCLALRELAARFASRQTDAEAAGKKKKKRITPNPRERNLATFSSSGREHRSYVPVYINLI